MTTHPVSKAAVRLFLLLAASLPLLGGCRSVDTGQGRTASAESLSRQQRESLRFVFAEHTTLPPDASAAEASALQARFSSAPRQERRELRRLYFEPELRLLATRDFDEDGILDYRVSEYYGKFLEGDVDLDGDGLRNTLDSAPYDSTAGGHDENDDGAPDRGFADHDSDGLPDHVDWSGSAENEMAQWQEELFERHRILLVNRSAAFSPSLVRSVWDATTRVFRKPLEAGSLPTLRTIATDDTCLLSREVDDGTNGMTIPQSQTLLIYRIGVEYPPLAQLGLLVHELGHVWQFALDFDKSDPAAENRRSNFPAARFAALVEPFGWSAEPFSYDSEEDHSMLFTPQYLGYEPAYLYQGETSEAWLSWIDEIYSEVGDAYLEDPRLAGVVGEYSLTSPWEWHADNLMAYFFLALEERARQRLTPARASAAIATLRATVADAWPGFRYLNFDRELLEEHYRSSFPQDETDLDYFVDHYLGETIQ